MADGCANARLMELLSSEFIRLAFWGVCSELAKATGFTIL
jgi:hypothetical protein